MSLATRIAAFADRAVDAVVARLPATITVGASTYDCAIDAQGLSQLLAVEGMDPSQTLDIIVPNSEGFTPTLGLSITIASTGTDALEGIAFTVASILAHPTLPAKILTVAKRP